MEADADPVKDGYHSSSDRTCQGLVVVKLFCFRESCERGLDANLQCLPNRVIAYYLA